MKNIFLNTLFLFLSIITFAQTSDISISVSDAETNEPLLGATVYFEELEKGAVTDFDGIATFTEIPNGNHIIKISYIGLKLLLMLEQKRSSISSSNREAMNLTKLSYNLQEVHGQ